MIKKALFFLSAFSFLLLATASAQRRHENFDSGWKFWLGDDSLAVSPTYNDNKWRNLNLPHDWSIEGAFSDKNPSTPNEAGLPTGIGWYRKTFTLPADAKGKRVSIDFDGVYRDSKVWINGHLLGYRPNGYISFSYDLTPYLNFGGKNVIVVKVDNSGQPNSRWYSGSGIYRHVWLETTACVAINQWGTFVTTPKITKKLATVNLSVSLKHHDTIVDGHKQVPLVNWQTTIYDANGNAVAVTPLSMEVSSATGNLLLFEQKLAVKNPVLWSVEKPYLYKAVTKVYYWQPHSKKDHPADSFTTFFGIRSFNFDAKKGFSLNGKHLKINGVCLHGDEGALGAAVNTRAMERQLQIMKTMGCNAIRTSHNPPAPEFLDLCDRMGFLVLDEAFDMWKKKKTKHDYAENWDAWHAQDLKDHIMRDRNHPSVFMWSVGNEIREQFDSTGISITRELVNIVKSLDNTRPVTSALSEADPNKNFIYKSAALDVIGLNYHPEKYASFPENYPGQKFISTESISGYATRGFYDKPTDSTRHWPASAKAPLKGNPEMAITSYDNVAAYWGSTHEETWKIIKKYDFLSGMFVWTGFDYLGEPSPYPWPARSSYFGIVDLAGFPKDVYYMYQSEWTSKPVLHLLPHWNWKTGDTVDVWAYYNCADEVELFLNGKSLGVKKKTGDDLHISWKVKFEPGVLKAVSRKNGKVVLTSEVRTAGAPAKIELVADHKNIKADGSDLCYVTVKIVDAAGNVVPNADNEVNFEVSGAGFIAGVDNGSQVSMESFKADRRKAFHGLCLAILQSNGKTGPIKLTAKSPGLKMADMLVNARR